MTTQTTTLVPTITRTPVVREYRIGRTRSWADALLARVRGRRAARDEWQWQRVARIERPIDLAPVAERTRLDLTLAQAALRTAVR